MRYSANLSDDDPTPIAPMPPSAIPEVPETALSVNPSADTPHTVAKSPPANSSKKATPKKKSNDEKTRAEPADSTPVLTRSRSGREIKPPRNSDFVYNCA